MLNMCLHVFAVLQIGSTILAQAAGVPTLPWSGSGVAVSFADCNGVIPEDTYNKACVFSLDEAIESCQRIGYPIMLKASWGGGGKGIRKVHNDDEVRQVFKQIQGEVRDTLQLVIAAAATGDDRGQQQWTAAADVCHDSACCCPCCRNMHISVATWQHMVCMLVCVALRASTLPGTCCRLFAAGAWLAHLCHEAGTTEPALGGAAGG
jgi:hypothetical protein